MVFDNLFIDGWVGEIIGNFVNCNYFVFFVVVGCIVVMVWMLGKGCVKVDRVVVMLGFVLLFVFFIFVGGLCVGFVLVLIVFVISLLLVWCN